MRKILLSLLIAVFVVVASPLVVGYYLSPQDKLEKGDVVVVVSGGETEARIKEGVSIYKQGYAPKIIFAGAAREGEVSNALAMKRIAISAGVPSENIFIEENSKDTKENAKNSAEIIRKNNFNKIILTTSPYHQRRTYQNFRKELPEATLINWSAKDSKWRKYGWWRTEEGRQLTFSELAKVLYLSTKDKD